MKLKLPWYFIVIIIIILFSAVAVFYRGQDIKQFAFGIFNVQFWPKQQQQTQPSKDLSEQKKDNTPPQINQHTEGDQSPAVTSGGDVIINNEGKKK